MAEINLQRNRAAQVGFVMRSYRESFLARGGRRGLTQEALLERMGSVDSEYAERYSHATVSRWESGATRPSLQRIRVFGKALNLSRAEVAGLILLAGLAQDFQAALRQVTGSERGEAIGHGTAQEQMLISNGADTASPSPILVIAIRFWLFRVLPLGVCIVGGYALSLLGWNNGWMPTAYVHLVVGIVLAQGFLLPDRDAPLREFFWVSLFFLLTTPMLQFASIRTDHYGFYAIGNLGGTQIPYMLALMTNLALASAAGMMFHLLWRRQYSGESRGNSTLRRAASVALTPVILAYAVSVAITNTSVAIQLTVLLPVLAAVFTALLVMRDPAFSLSERDRQFLLWTMPVLGILSAMVGIGVMFAIYLSPHMPSVFPDHNLLTSWEINFPELGLTREEAMKRLNLGYMWHAIWAFAYMSFVVGGNLIVAIYRIDGGRNRSSATVGHKPGVENPIP